ncbi:MAG: PotD/PotF family extracellular solute-binding protein [Halolamina sp.]
MSDTQESALDRSSRRSFLQAATAAGVTTSLAGCVSGDAGSGGLADITLMQWGGEFGETAQKVLKEPFEEEFDVTVEQVPLPGPSEMLSKLQAGATDFDLVSHWDYTLYRGVNNDLFQEIPLDEVPNVRDRVTDSFDPTGADYDPGSAAHHVPYSVSGWGMTYNEEQLSDPTSWDAVLADDVAGEMSNASWMSCWLGVAAKHAGVPFDEIPDRIDEIWEMIERYDQQSQTWWGTGQQMERLLRDGSVSVGSFWFARTYRLRVDEDVPVRYTVPEEGAPAWIETYTIPNGVSDAKRETALEFLNFINREEIQKNFGRELRYAVPYDFDRIPDDHIYADHPELPLVGTDRLEPMNQRVYNSNYNDYSNEFQQRTG